MRHALYVPLRARADGEPLPRPSTLAVALELAGVALILLAFMAAAVLA